MVHHLVIKNLKRRHPLCTLSHSGIEVPPILRKIYENRHIEHISDVVPSLEHLYSPFLLKDIDISTELLSTAIKDDKSIMIIGDYDTDGATATALSLLCLRAMGAKNVKYLVPNRFEYGYGLSKKMAQLALNSSPDLLVTVDNGISSIEGVKLLNENNVQVIITDHHLPGDLLPKANAIVNPSQPECNFPSKNLSGVGVIFHVLLVLRAKLRKERWFERNNIPIPNCAEYLDLVALGTVADMVPLDKNNRILVAQGIARIRSGKCRAGVSALLDIVKKSYKRVTSSDLGFFIAPRINAAGRLKDMSTGIECLLASSKSVAKSYAAMLCEINNERRQIESVMQKKAYSIVKNCEAEWKKSNHCKQSGFCLFDPSWNQGVIGLLASKIKDHTSQPTVVFAPHDKDMLAGSARSIPGLNMRNLIASIAENKLNLIIKFGGHSMAAGLMLHKKDLSVFQTAYHEYVNKHFLEFGYEGSILFSDGQLSELELTLEYADLLKNVAPWGSGFPVPVFDGVFHILDYRIVGGQHIRFYLKSESGNIYDAIAFKSLGFDENLSNFTQIHAMYQMDINEFRGKRSLQLILEKFKSID